MTTGPRMGPSQVAQLKCKALDPGQRVCTEASCAGTCPCVAAFLCGPARTFQISRQKQNCVRSPFQLNQLSPFPLVQTPLQTQNLVPESSILRTTSNKGHAMRDHSKRQAELVTVSSAHSHFRRACPQTKGTMMTANKWTSAGRKRELPSVFAVILLPQTPSPTNLHNFNLTACVCFPASPRKHRYPFLQPPLCHIRVGIANIMYFISTNPTRICWSRKRLGPLPSVPTTAPGT